MNQIYFRHGNKIGELSLNSGTANPFSPRTNYSRTNDDKQLLYILVKLVVFIVRGDVTWMEIII